MATYNCHPPSRRHNTQQISPFDALSLVSKYLAAANSNAALHPNALLTEVGPTTPSSSTHQVGLMLHNLRRIEAGLRGEHLAVDLILNDDTEKSQDAVPRLQSGSHRNDDGLADGVNGWQDKAEFEREQDIEQGEIGDRNNVVGDQGDGINVPHIQVEGTKSAADKDAQRRTKKARRSQQQKGVQARRKSKSQSED